MRTTAQFKVEDHHHHHHHHHQVELWSDGRVSLGLIRLIKQLLTFFGWFFTVEESESNLSIINSQLIYLHCIKACIGCLTFKKKLNL